MRAWASKAMVLGATGIAAMLAACAVDSTSSSGSGYAGGGWGGSSSGSTAPSFDAGAGPQPMLVDVDPNVPLSVTGGQGVGVFTEYTAGGHWHVSWTCDTSLTGLSCNFDVMVAARSGSITNVVGQFQKSHDTVWQPATSSLEAQTFTTTEVDGVTFDAAPGTIITVDAAMDGLRDGAFMFFVQDGVRNGAFTGTLTDPLMFEPSSP